MEHFLDVGGWQSLHSYEMMKGLTFEVQSLWESWLIWESCLRHEDTLQQALCALAPSFLQLRDRRCSPSPLTRSSALFGYPRCLSKWGGREKKCFRGKILAIFLLVGGPVVKGTIGLTLPGSHLKAYQVTLSDSVTMANNLTKAIVLSSPSPGQITDQSEFI